MPQNPNNILKAALSENKFEISETIQQLFIQYLELLQRWNKAFNLTAITDIHDMIWLHIVDSLALNPYLHGTRIIDVGTGAGLPGIPLALINPDKHFVLLDSNSKKTRFLTQAKMTLGINNIEIIHARCEDFGAKNPVPEPFDSIVSRAFSSIAVMLERTQHLAADGGQFLAMKGIYPEQEIQEIPADFSVTEIHKLTIKGLAAERHVVCIQKK
jgi:16S rRNA (guanine527-N7)-methyltransferase